MGIYLDNVVVGAISLPFIAAILTLPYLIYQYGRFGGVSFRKTLMVLLFLFYVVCAFYMVVLPLPADRSAVVPGARIPQMDPLYLYHGLVYAEANTGFSFSHPSTWVHFLKQPVVYECVFNLALTVPFGFMLRYFFKRGVLVSLVLGFLLSLFFELTQLTGLWGLYAYPYRLFDLCDLMTNTAGAVIGSILAIPLVYLLPDLDDANARSEERGARRVSATRRFVAFVVDMGLCGLCSLGTALALLGIDATELSWSQMGESTIVLGLLLFLLFSVVFFMLVPTITGGQTIGHKLVGIVIVSCDEDERPHFWNYLIRYGILIWCGVLLPLWLILLRPIDTFDGVSAQTVSEVVLMLWGFWLLSLVVRAVVSLFGPTFTMAHGQLSGTMVDSVQHLREVEKNVLAAREQFAREQAARERAARERTAYERDATKPWRPMR
jgi:glycopeptide antibiotics resistance protein